MPIYEYECTDCGNQFEILQLHNENPRISCEACNGGNVNRIISPGAFIFKGSGFYATDYKAKERKRAESKAPECSSCKESNSCPAAKSED